MCVAKELNLQKNWQNKTNLNRSSLTVYISSTVEPRYCLASTFYALHLYLLSSVFFAKEYAWGQGLWFLCLYLLILLVTSPLISMWEQTGLKCAAFLVGPFSAFPMKKGRSLKPDFIRLSPCLECNCLVNS